jgi:hypothetical protein
MLASAGIKGNAITEVASVCRKFRRELITASFNVNKIKKE